LKNLNELTFYLVGFPFLTIFSLFTLLEFKTFIIRPVPLRNDLFIYKLWFFFRRLTVNLLIRSITYYIFTCFEIIKPDLITHHEHNNVYIVVGNWDFILHRMQIWKLVDLSFSGILTWLKHCARSVPLKRLDWIPLNGEVNSQRRRKDSRTTCFLFFGL